MVYELALGIRVPDWEVNHTLWIDDHFESGYLFRNAIKLELAPPPPTDQNGKWNTVGKIRGLAKPQEKQCKSKTKMEKSK